MYSQATYSLVGTTFDNRTLNSYREGLSDASELAVNSPEEFLDIFTTYHFTPTQVTEDFTLLAETASELEDIYTSLYKYSYANPNTVSVTRESVTEHTTWSSLTNYLEEVYDRIFQLLDNADQYDIETSKFEQKLEHLARTLYVYTAVSRTTFLTEFTIQTEDAPSFTFVEMPSELYQSLYPAWYLANSLGLLSELQKPTDPSYTPPTTLPPAVYTTSLPDTQSLKQVAENHNHLTTLTSDCGVRAVNPPLSYFTDTPVPEERPHRYASQLVDAYHTEVQELSAVDIVAD